MRNLFGYEKFSRSIGDCLLHATVVPCDDGFLSSVTIEDENRVLYQRESKFASSDEAAIHLHLQLERIAAKGPLSIPGMHSYDVPAGPIGVELRVHVFDPEQEWEKFAPRAEVLIDLDDVGLQLEDLEDYDQDILTGVSKFIGFPVRWADNQWHQNRSRNNPGWYRGTWSRNLSLPNRPKKSSEESGEFDTHEEPSITEVKPKLHYFSRRADMEGVPPRLFRPWAAAHDAKERFAADSTVANFDEFVQATAAFLQSAAPFGSALAGQTLPTVQQYVAQHPPASGEFYSQQEAERYMTYIDRIINRVHEDMLKATGTTREEWYAAKGTPTADPHASTPVMYLTPEEQAELGIFQKAPPQEKGPQAPFTEELWRRRTQGSVKTAEVLEHYSRQPNLTVVDPKYHGQGIAGAERRRKSNNPEYWVDRAYFYDAGSSPEAELANEQRYVAQLPAGAAIYDIGMDPENLATNALNEMGTPDVTRMEKAVKDGGYFGFRNTRGPIPYAVGVFYPVQVQKAQDATTAEMLITTMFVKHAGSTENYLQSIGVQPDVIQFIMKQEPETAKKLVNEVRKNVNLTGQELQQLVQTLQSKQYKPSAKELRLAQRYGNRPGMEAWVLLQLKRHRMKPRSDGEWEYNWIQVPALSYLAPDSSSGAIVDELDLIADWVRAQHPELASYDLLTAKKAQEAWHLEQASQGAGGKYEERNVVYTFKNGWTIQLVRTENDLGVEGNLMGHCVGSYCEPVALGSSIIYSLRDPRNLPHATIEVKGDFETELQEGEEYPYYSERRPESSGPVSGAWDIVQIQGKENQPPKPEYKSMIKEWFKSIGPENIAMEGSQDSLFDRLYNAESDELADILERANTADPGEYGIPAPKEEFDASSMQNVYEHIINTMDKRMRREHQYWARLMDPVAEALADLAWNSDMQRANSDWRLWSVATMGDAPPERVMEIWQKSKSAMAGIWREMDKHQETFDKWDHDYGLNMEDFETEDAFYEAEQKLRDENYEEWLSGGFDIAINKRWQQLAEQNNGKYPYQILEERLKARKPQGAV